MQQQSKAKTLNENIQLTTQNTLGLRDEERAHITFTRINVRICMYIRDEHECSLGERKEGKQQKTIQSPIICGGKQRCVTLKQCCRDVFYGYHLTAISTL